MVFVLAVNAYVLVKVRSYIVQKGDVSKTDVGIVLGARVYPSGRLSPMLEDRVNTMLVLYEGGLIDKILVSGDHGQREYDEVNTIKQYLLEKGVSADDLFLDHAGFDTYDSMYRAKVVFDVDSAVIVTQSFHLPRAVYIARALGIDAVGVSADMRPYRGILYNKAREIPSRTKAFVDLIFGAMPTFLGEKIPIAGDGRRSWD